MAATHPARLTASSPAARLTVAEGRRFALTLAAGFAVLGALAAWRGRQALSIALLTLAGAAMLAGFIMPTRLGGVQRGWLALGLALSRVTTPVFYTVLYLAVLMPMGLLRRTVGRSPLDRDPAATSYWVAREPASADERRGAMERQF